jgi:hypothetical protein
MELLGKESEADFGKQFEIRFLLNPKSAASLAKPFDGKFCPVFLKLHIKHLMGLTHSFFGSCREGRFPKTLRIFITSL